MSKRSKACDITPKVRREVMERDGHRCIVCRSQYRLELAHAKISRARLGLGVPKNLVVLCQTHHKMLDSGKYKDQVVVRDIVDSYLNIVYGDISENEIKYKKWD